MVRVRFCGLVILAFLLFTLGISLSLPSYAQEWAVPAQRGTLRVVDLRAVALSAMLNYAEPLVNKDKDNNVVPSLAKNWRWIDDRTIEFKLRKGVTFHNGERFNAEAVRVNWEEYRRMESPKMYRFETIPDETRFEIVDDYTVRFTLPEPDSTALGLKFWCFIQIAPAFFEEHEFADNNWAFLPEPGPWGTGPFRLVEGSVGWAGSSDRLVLEAYEDYWDPDYPKVQRLIFDNTLIGDRKEAMRLCREEEGAVDIVNFIRPLDTLKVAESPFAKVVKSKDISFLGCLLNQRKTDSKWKDVRLRKAVNYAINRKELWKYAAKGNAYNLEGYPIPAGAYGHDPDLTPWTYDTTKARELLAEAGFPDGFEVKFITHEAWRLEAQIMKRMLERIGLTPRLEVLTYPEWLQRTYMPLLEKPPEEHEWDLAMWHALDWATHTAASFLSWPFIDDGESRWIMYDPIYEEMFKDMARTVDREALEENIRQLEQYVYDRAYMMFIYSPLTLYAVNKEVNFVPQKYEFLCLKETSVTDNHWSIRKKVEAE